MVSTVQHDVVRVSDGLVVGVIESRWDSLFPGEFTLDGFPAGGALRGAESFGNVPQGALDVFCGVYGKLAADARRRFSFRPRSAG